MTHLTTHDFERLKSAIVLDIQKDYFLVPRNVKMSEFEREELLEYTLQWVCAKFCVDPRRVRDRGNKSDYVHIRAVFYYLSKEHIDRASLHAIGKYMCRSHATVLHGYNTLKDLMEVDKVMRTSVKFIEEEFKLIIQDKQPIKPQHASKKTNSTG